MYYGKRIEYEPLGISKTFPSPTLIIESSICAVEVNI